MSPRLAWINLFTFGEVKTRTWIARIHFTNDFIKQNLNSVKFVCSHYAFNDKKNQTFSQVASTQIAWLLWKWDLGGRLEFTYFDKIWIMRRSILLLNVVQVTRFSCTDKGVLGNFLAITPKKAGLGSALKDVIHRTGTGQNGILPALISALIDILSALSYKTHIGFITPVKLSSPQDSSIESSLQHEYKPIILKLYTLIKIRSEDLAGETCCRKGN